MMPICAVAFATQAQPELHGVVLDAAGRPVAGAKVEGPGFSALTDARGRFRAKAEAAVELRVSAPGMEAQSRRAVPGEALVLQLQPQAQATVEVVEGSGYGSGEGGTSTLSRLEIYTTPGAAADVFQAVKGLPGVSNASEGAELYVRGGRPEEVGIYLNGGRLARPFHHPNTQGGIFSVVDTALVTRVDFVPGGFSARYGDALSAVLDLSTEVDTPARTTAVLLTLPTQGLSADRPLGPGLLRGSLRHSDPVLLDKWYGLAPNFQESPVSLDGQLNWQQDLGNGRLQLTGMGNRDHLATEVHIANQLDVYTNRSRGAYLDAQWRGALNGETGLTAVLSRHTFHQDWSYGRWGMHQAETGDFARLEATRALSEGRSLEGGVDAARQSYGPEGQVPYDPADWGPRAEARRFAYAFDGRRAGAYLTARSRIGDRWGLSLGGRLDRYGLLDETTRDLRGTLTFQARERLTFRASWGTFHQAPALQQLDPYAGNPALRAQRATHALVSMDAAWGGSVAWNLRAEAYRKDYDHLVQDDARTRYADTGRGRAEGLDLLVKASLPGFRGWIGYGYLNTRRREGKQTELGPVPTSVPHNLTAVGTWKLRPGLEAALSWRYASGAPVTPVLGGRPQGDGFEPVQGSPYSDALPAYGRADLRLTRLFSWRGARVAAFAEVMNLLNRHNAASYSYSADFGTRRVEESYFSRRILVAGASLSW